ncbi:MAG TPA: ABC transporter permease [Acidimicrobiales bacterium]|nr:ABC transporter permease [Acidimicrobiales bacterium]
MSVTDLTIILSGIVKLSAPLLFAGLGEYTAERAGTLNISIEAMMLTGAYCGMVGASATGSAVLGLPIGIGGGLAVAIVHANFSHRLAANTFVVGLTLNALALGLTDYLFTSFQLSSHSITAAKVPLLSHIPVLGPALFDVSWPVYFLFGLVPAVWWALQRSQWGLEVRACGENPHAADATGITVNRRRRQALYVCGMLSGLGGAFLSLGIVGQFNQGMTAGIGYVVIAAVIFGGWTLWGTVLGCVLFGTADAMGLVLPALGHQLNPQLLLALPYLAALAAMVFLAKSYRAPRALARPFSRGLA